MKKIIYIVILIVIIGFFSYQNGISSPADQNGENIVFVVSPGETSEIIAENLKKNKLINSKFYFEVYVWQKGLAEKLQAGEYILNPNMNIKEIASKLVKGQSLSKEREIKIIEGWTIRDIGQYFEREGMFQSEEFLELVGFPLVDYRYNKEMPIPKDYSDKFDFLNDKPNYLSLEGYLFPDTYRIFKDASLDDIVVKMLNNLDKKLTKEMREDIKKQGKTIYEIITMASLIQKEVQSEEDMKIVSGIFWDRIKNGQPLESCATLAYILGHNKPQYTLEDTEIDSPYNTYKHKGLPPGPICNPGLQAIKAAIYPTFTDYNYFLTDPKTKKTIFSITYQEHLNNKAKYLD